MPEPTKAPLPDDEDDLLDRLQPAAMLALGLKSPPTPEPPASKEQSAFLAELFPEYHFAGELNHGGFGVVYRAEHRKLKRRMALKILSHSLTRNVTAVARFEREIEAVGKLDHPGIVRASDAGERGGVWFLAMEFIEGMDLSRLSKAVGPLPPADAAELGRGIALALSHAHAQGLIHRDVKPSNVMLAVDAKGGAPSVKVLDFGLAQLSADAAAGFTISAELLGTVEYIAPEQVENPRCTDLRSDLYGLGATLYRLLTGLAPHEQPDSQETLLQKLTHVAQSDITPVRTHRPDVPESLAALVDRLLQRDPANRPSSGAEVAEALAPFCAAADLPALAARALATAPVTEWPAPGRTQRIFRRNGRLKQMLVTASVAAAVWLATLWMPGLIKQLPIARQALDISNASPMATAALENATLGYQFDLDAPMEIRELGWFDHGSDGLSKPVNIAIWHSADRQIVVQGTVGTARARAVASAEKSGRWLFEALPTPVRLEPGAYIIGGTVWSAERDPVMVQAEVDDRLPGFRRRQNMTTTKRTRSTSEPGTLHLPDNSAMPSPAEGVTKRWFGPNLIAKPLSPSPAPPAQTLVFDGFDDLVKVPTLRYTGQLPYTIEAMVFLAPDLDKQQSTVVTIGAPHTIKLSLHHGQWEARRGKDARTGDAALFEAKETDLGRWLHVAAVWTTPEAPAALFVDGQPRPLVNTTPFGWGGIRSPEVPAGIGAHFHPDNRRIGEDRLRGRLAELRISKFARYSAPFTPPEKGDRLPLDEHTEALYHFEPTPGEAPDHLRDASPNNHHGTIIETRWAPFR